MTQENIKEAGRYNLKVFKMIKKAESSKDNTALDEFISEEYPSKGKQDVISQRAYLKRLAKGKNPTKAHYVKGKMLYFLASNFTYAPGIVVK